MNKKKMIYLIIFIAIIIILIFVFNNPFKQDKILRDENGYIIENNDVYEINNAIRNNDYKAIKNKINKTNINQLPYKKGQYKLLDDSDPDYEDRYRNSPPLIEACAFGHYDIIKLLLDNGADINIKEENSSNTPLMYLFENQDRNENTYKITKLLLEQYKEHNFNKELEAFIDSSYALDNKNSGKNINLNIFKLLYETNSKNIESYSNIQKGELLTKAATTNNLSILKYLLEEKKYDVNLQSENGDTALISATYMDRIDIVKYLLSMNADKTIKNDRNKIALDYAKEPITIHSGGKDYVYGENNDELIKILQ